MDLYASPHYKTASSNATVMKPGPSSLSKSQSKPNARIKRSNIAHFKSADYSDLFGRLKTKNTDSSPKKFLKGTGFVAKELSDAKPEQQDQQFKNLPKSTKGKKKKQDTNSSQHPDLKVSRYSKLAPGKI